MKKSVACFNLFILACLTIYLSSPALATSQPQQTGQTSCFTVDGTITPCIGTGQDGDIRAGIAWPNNRFITNPDATVTDQLTGLAWTADASTAGPAECALAGSPLSWQEALLHVQCLNQNQYLGQSDWRLPNINELHSLLNEGKANSATWLGTLGAFSNVPTSIAAFFWSATSFAGTPAAALGVKLGSSDPEKLTKTAAGYAWSVRGPVGAPTIQLPRTGQILCFDENGNTRNCAGSGEDGDSLVGIPWPTQRFMINSNQTITDALTGLTWGQYANLMVTYDQTFDTDGTLNDGAVAWDKALLFIKKLNNDQYKGFTDWRLPNVFELLTLVDNSEATATIPLTMRGFSLGTSPPSSWWSSTTSPVATGQNQVFALQSADGTLVKTIKLAHAAVWPVRGGNYGNALIEVAPISLTFGPIVNGSSSVSREIVIKNATTEKQNLVIDKIYLTDTNDSDASFFSFDLGGGNPCASLTPTIAPGTNCTLTVNFSSIDLGTKNAILRINSNAASGPAAVPLVGSTVDGTPPTGSFFITSRQTPDDVAVYTNTRDVSLKITTTDDSGGDVWMRFSNSPTSWGSTWTLFESWNPYFNWTLGANDGLQTVYAQFKDADGNISLISFDTVILKTTRPDKVKISGVPANGTTNSRSLVLTISGTDIAQYTYSLSPAQDQPPPPDTWFSSSIPIILTDLPATDPNGDPILYTLTVIGQDFAQNRQLLPTTATWVIDLTPPTISFDPLINPTNVKNPIISGQVDSSVTADIDVTIKPAGNATAITGKVAPSNGAWNYSIPGTGLNLGANQLIVTAHDPAGNSASASTWLTFDNVPPTATVSGVPLANAPTNMTTASLIVGGSEVVAYKYSLDGGAESAEFAAATPIFEANLDTKGPIVSGNRNHTISVKGKDLAGNWQTTGTTYTWTVDTTPPTVTIIPPLTPTSVDTPTLQGTLNETATVSVYYAQTNTTLAATVSGLQWSLPTPAAALATNSNRITVTATDSAGNSSSASTVIFVDKIAPTPTITSSFGTTVPPQPSPNPVTNATTATFTIGGPDIITYKYQISPASGVTASPAPSTTVLTPVSTAISLGALTPATYTLTVTGYDSAGNSGVTTLTWQVVTASPTITLTGLPLPTNTSATVTVSGVVEILYAFDNQSYRAPNPTDPCQVVNSFDSLKVCLPVITDGPHTLLILGKDAYGNWNLREDKWVSTLNEPIAVLSGLPTNPSRLDNTAGKLVSISVGGNNVAYYTWSFGNGAQSAFKSISEKIPLPTLTNGTTYVLNVWGYNGDDSGGNTNWTKKQNTPTTYIWTVDTLLPVAELAGVPPSNTTATSATIYVSGTGVVSYNYQLDTGTTFFNIPISVPITLTSLSDGLHTIKVFATDAAGNVQTSSTNASWTINPAAAVVKVTSGFPIGQTKQTTWTMNIACPTGVTSYTYALTDGTNTIATAVNACTDPLIASTVGLPDGRYSLSIDTVPTQVSLIPPLVAKTTFSWLYDTTPPTAGFSSKPAGQTNSSVASFAITGTDLDNFDVVSYTYRLDNDLAGYSASIPVKTVTTLTGLKPTNNNDPLDPPVTHTFDVKGCDHAGNCQATPTTHTWIIDRTAPIVTLTPLSSPTNLTSQTIGGNVNDPDAVVTITNTTTGNSGTATVTKNGATSTWSFALNGLVSGTNNITIEATDLAGNSGTATGQTELKTAMPVAVVTGVPTVPTNSTTLTFNVSGTNIQGYKYQLDGGAWLPTALPDTTSYATGDRTITVAAGQHTLKVIGHDNASNWQPESGATTKTWLVDVAPPVATLTPNSMTTTGVPSATFTVGGVGVVKYKAKLDQPSGVAAGYTALVDVAQKLSFTGLANGSYKLWVVGCDFAGNCQDDASGGSAPPTTLTWDVVVAAPTIVITSPTTSPTKSPDLLLAGTVTASAGLTVSMVVTNMTTGIDSTVTVTGTSWNTDATVTLTSGINTIKVSATDSLGNSASKLIEIDFKATAPFAMVLSGIPSSPTNATSINLTIGGANVVKYRYSLDKSAYSAYVPVATPLLLDTTTSPALTSGVRRLWIEGMDAAGNAQILDVDTAPATLTWTIDTSLPTVAITSLTTPTSSPDQIISGTVSGAVSVSVSFDTATVGGSATLKNNNTGWDFQTSSSPLTGLQPGLNTVTVTATSLAGNKASVQASIYYDNLPPVATISGAPTGVTRATTATLAIGGNGIVAYKYSLDGDAFSANFVDIAELIILSLEEGPHTVAVIGKKASGAEQATIDATTASWTVDTTAPIALIISGQPAAQTRVQDLNISVGGAGVVSYRYSLDGRPYSTEALISQPIVESGLLIGPHILNLIGRDAAGNWQAVPTHITWTIDITPPAGILVAGLPTNPSNNNAINLTISGGDVAYYQYALDGAAYSASTEVVNPLAISGISDGSHTILIRGVDLAGNTQLVPFSFTWTVDTVAPSTTASPRGGEYSSTLSVVLTASEPATIYYTVDGTTPTISSTIYNTNTPIKIGKSTSLRFFARDLAGNLETVKQESYSFISNGDANGDGSIDIQDVILTLRYAVGTLTYDEQQKKRLDVAPLDNFYKPAPDGFIDIRDCIVIMKRAIGLLSW